MKNKKLDTLITIGLVLCLLVGLVVTFNKPIRNAIMGHTIREHRITKVSKKVIDKNKKKKVSYDFDAIKPVSSDEVLKDTLSRLDGQQLPTIGGIAIPDVNINLPIYKGVDSNSLLYGSGTMKPEQEMGRGNYALASHHVFGNRDDLLFTPLVQAKTGMMIYITDKSKVYTYVIDKVFRVQPDRVDVIDDHGSEKEITLVTCVDRDATQRLIVQGHLTNTELYDTASKTVKQAFGADYNY